MGNRLRIGIKKETDHPSNRESVRPTVRPDLLRRKTNIVSAATTSTLFIATTKVAAFGRHHKRGAAAFGRGTSFVVSFVVAMKRGDVVAVNTIFVLRLSKTGRTVGRTDSRVNGWSVGRTHGCLFCEGPAGGVDFGKLRFMIF